MAASGPRVIGLAAVVADRITFAVGADVERLAWAIEVARTARRDAGLDPDGLGLGAYVNVAVHPDRAVARQLVAGGLSTLARFNVMHGTPVGPYDEQSAAMLTELHSALRHEPPHAGGLGAGGHHHAPTSPTATPCSARVDEVRARLLELAGLGLDKFVLMGVGRAPGLDDESKLAYDSLVREVMPALTS